jgi:hypothetical protein
VTDISPERILIQQEETKFRAAVSESTLSRVGATSNFINLYQANMREFMLNGKYGSQPTPNLGVDGIVKFPFDWELVDVYIYSGESTSGTGITELDLKWKPFASGAYATIFSTTPKFTSAASAFETVGIGQSKPGFTTPVLSVTTFNAHDQIRIDLLSAINTAIGCGIGITFRPR